MVRRRFFSAVSNHGPRGHPRATAPPLSRETHASAAQERRRCLLLRMRVYPGAKQNQRLGPLFLFRSSLVRRSPPSGEGGCDDRVSRSSKSEGGSNPVLS